MRPSERRFTLRIEIPLPDEAGRRELLKRFLADDPWIRRWISRR